MSDEIEKELIIGCKIYTNPTDEQIEEEMGTGEAFVVGGKLVSFWECDECVVDSFGREALERIAKNVANGDDLYDW